MSALPCLQTLGALAVIALAGHGALRLLLRGEFANTPTPERLGLTWLLGTGWVSLAIFAAGWAVRGAALIALIAAGAALLAILGQRVQIPRAPTWRPRNALEWLLVAALGVELILIATWSTQFAFGWDGLALWEAKARIAAAHGGALPLAYFREFPFAWVQPRYPLYLPYSETWLYLCLGRADQAWVRIFGPLTYAAAALIIVGATERLRGARTAGLAVAVAMFFVPYFFTGTWHVLAGYADFPLGVLYLAAVSRLPGITREPTAAECRLFAALSALVVWGKQEGFYLWLVLIAFATLALARAGRWRWAIWSAAPAALLTAAFALYLKFVRSLPDPFYQAPTPANIAAHLDRFGPVLARLFTEISDLESWSLLWPGAALAVIALAMRRAWSPAFAFAWALALPLGLYVMPFVLSALDDYLIHAEHAQPRLLLQLAPTALLAIALAIPRLLVSHAFPPLNAASIGRKLRLP